MSDLVPQDDYASIQDSLRPWVAQRLKKMYEALEPYVDGSYGDVDPRHAAAAVAVLRQLGSLYRVNERPKADTEGLVSEEQVQARIAEAVAVARLEWQQQRLELESAAREAVASMLRQG